jgi:hypothetical protein
MWGAVTSDEVEGRGYASSLLSQTPLVLNILYYRIIIEAITI